MSARRENEHKQFVEVRAEHQLGGAIKPIMFREEDDLYTPIDEIIDVREAPALRAGGQGIRPRLPEAAQPMQGGINRRCADDISSKQTRTTRRCARLLSS